MDLQFAPQSPADLLPGDVGFSTIPGRVGGIVAFAQAGLDLVDIIRSHDSWRYAENLCIWTHAYLVLPGGRLYEAMPKGSRIVSLAGRWGPNFAYGRVPLTDEQRGRVDEVARRKEGTPYGWSDYAALAAVELGLPGGRPLRRYVSTNKREICSQAVDAAWCELGFHLFTDQRLPQDVTPGALYWQVARKGQTYLMPRE